jgi:hypothetical protein
VVQWEGLGQRLEALASSARKQIVVVAPFIKRAALQRLLANAPAATPLLCVTRWRVDEIACGVSDLAVWEDLAARGNASLLLVKDLHAKFYRCDNLVMIGSHNVTGTALGFRQPSNLELSVELEADMRTAAFEARLEVLAVPATRQLYEAMLLLVAAMPSDLPPPGSGKGAAGDDGPTVAASQPDWSGWLPVCRTPSALFDAYAGRFDELTQATRDGALADLTNLSPPAGLNRQQFEAFVGAAVLSSPMVAKLAEFAIVPRRFGEMRALLRNMSPAGAATGDWQTTMRWLLHFLPDRFAMHTANYSEVFVAKW